MKKQEQKKEQPAKKVALLKAHKEAILCAFNRAVTNAKQEKERAFFTGFVNGAMAELFSRAELEHWRYGNHKLCADICNDGEVTMYTNDGGKYDRFDVNITMDKLVRIPARLGLTRKLYDKAKLQHEIFYKEEQASVALAHQVVWSCRNTADIRETWPQGERFWKPMVDRLELESGTGACTSLIPISQIKKLNAICAGLTAEGGVK